MPGVLADFHGRYPGVTVAVEKLTSRAVEAALLAGRLDVGVTFAPPAAAELLPEKLFDERIVLAVPRGHRLARDAGPAPFAALADLPLALTTPEFATRQLLDATAAAARVRLRVALEFNDIDLLLMTLARLPPKADLATVLARRAVRGHAAAVVLRPIVSPALTRTAYLLWHRDRHRPQAARVLADMIRSGGKDWTADR
jgi:LysR family cyn operon transcriptional activator